MELDLAPFLTYEWEVCCSAPNAKNVQAQVGLSSWSTCLVLILDVCNVFEMYLGCCTPLK